MKSRISLATHFFCKQRFYKQRQAEVGKKLCKYYATPLGFCYLKIAHIFHPCYHPKRIRHTLKNAQKNKCVCIHEIILLIIMEMMMKKKDYIDKAKIDLGLDMDANIVNIIIVSVL